MIQTKCTYMFNILTYHEIKLQLITPLSYRFYYSFICQYELHQEKKIQFPMKREENQKKNETKPLKS